MAETRKAKPSTKSRGQGEREHIADPLPQAPAALGRTVLSRRGLTVATRARAAAGPLRGGGASGRLIRAGLLILIRVHEIHVHHPSRVVTDRSAPPDLGQSDLVGRPLVRDVRA